MTRKRPLQGLDDPRTQEADHRFNDAVGDHLIALVKFSHQAARDWHRDELHVLSHYISLWCGFVLEEVKSGTMLTLITLISFDVDRALEMGRSQISRRKF
jgi:hypothetical protein